MKISKDEVLHVAALARLDMSDAEIETMAAQIGDILEYVGMLNSVDTQDVAPTTHAISIENAFRDDAFAQHLTEKATFANAPEDELGHFLVPKVVG